MANKTLRFISNKMKNLDICMMSTMNSNKELHTRPMSNNKDVKYNGESFFFTMEDTRKVSDIKKHANVTLSFIGEEGLYIIVSGKARIIKSLPMLEEHWVPSLEQWFKDGIDTKGLTLLAVKAEAIKYWDHYKEGEIDIK